MDAISDELWDLCARSPGVRYVGFGLLPLGEMRNYADRIVAILGAE